MSGSIGDEEKEHDSGVGGEFYEGDRSTGGNRWPRQETHALLKIRSDMDGVFRDSSLKGPLWEQVSRKMAELGYHRSSKKCKEKFENVYKYHKRTKDGRVGKSDGKTYRFFDQLEALEQHHSPSSPFPQLPPATPRGTQQSQPSAQAAVPVTMVIPAGTHHPASVTVTSSVVHTAQVQIHQVERQMNVTPIMTHVGQQHRPMAVHHSNPIQMENGSSPSATPSSSSLSGSDEEEVLGRRRRKRKWKEFFERLTKEVIDKQEELQKKFLDVVEKRECDRLARDEAWRAQEIGRLNREHQILVQERSMAAAKDAALMAFLQKLSDQQQIPLSLPVQTQTETQTQVRGVVPAVTSTAPTAIHSPVQPRPVLPPQQSPESQVKSQQTQVLENPVSLATPIPITITIQPQLQAPAQQALAVANTMNTNEDIHKTNNCGENQVQGSPSRWPKAEVEALINLRTKLDEKYQESGPKGPLWEEISSSMKTLGYNRNAKRCKEKWENINKYFKKVKESNKRRPEDSKTCPYFHQLDALYRGKTPKIDTNYSPQQQQQQQMKPNTMARPDQQWPGPDQDHHRMEEDDGDEDGDDEGNDDDDDDDDEGSGGYEIVANSAATTTTAE